MEGGCHLPVSIRPLLADNGHLGPRRAKQPGNSGLRNEGQRERRRLSVLQPSLFLLDTWDGGLMSLELERCGFPDVVEREDIIIQDSVVTHLDDHPGVCPRLANLCDCHTLRLKYSPDSAHIFHPYLIKEPGRFTEERGQEQLTDHTVEVQTHTSAACEGHLENGNQKPTVRPVVSSSQQTASEEPLSGNKSRLELWDVNFWRDACTRLAQHLRESGATQSWSTSEIHKKEHAVTVGLQVWRYLYSHIGNWRVCSDDQLPRALCGFRCSSFARHPRSH
mmetsp:Transcript_34230/g.91361  ORF Transcript_34230/g.91361 Transcript_34230/m.91361 type:complete len:278 (-) Transcript_34230:2441-3274(-)